MESAGESYCRYLKGDEQAFAEIVRAYKDGLILYLNEFTHNISAAEELTEDTFVKLGVRRPVFRNEAAFKTWLYAIGRHTALDYIRRESRRKTVPLESCAEIADREVLESSYIKEEQKLAVHHAMEKLKQEYRQALWLIYFEEFSTRETAKIMKKSVHNIETLVYRARQALKAELNREGFVYEDF